MGTTPLERYWQAVVVRVQHLMRRPPDPITGESPPLSENDLVSVENVVRLALKLVNRDMRLGSPQRALEEAEAIVEGTLNLELAIKDETEKAEAAAHLLTDLLN